MAAVAFASVFIFGVVIGYFGKPSTVSDNSLMRALVADKLVASPDLVFNVMKEIDTNMIRDYLKELSKEPHIAGLKRDNELTEWIKTKWEDAGLDHVDLAEYDFFLSWPNHTNPNKIHLLDGAGAIQFTSQHKEKELQEGDDHPNFIHGYNAFTPAGTVEGDLVYVNYARVEDIRELEDLLGRDFIKDKICIARYGKVFRGDKLKNCQDRGAKAIIFFSDPADVALLGTEPENVYPNTRFLPGSGIQRGSTFLSDGEPLSPGFASVKNAYRLDPSDVVELKKIPAQPIGYDDAKVLLEKMGGHDPPSDKWKGKIDVDYKLGGKFKEPWSNWTVKLSTHNYERTVKSSSVIGILKGSTEPDRYVLLGNHRDAWGFGAIDPSSGTAQLMEVVRIFGKMKKSGWRPRRTLVFASWAAEDTGIFGSYEFVYQHLAKLQYRTVGVVNTDICVAGPVSKAQASPIMRDIVIEAFKHASDPTTDTERSYYDYFKKYTNIGNNGLEKEIKISHLGAGSDHAPFAFYAGIPAFNSRFKDDGHKYKGIGQYPTYHTGYETFNLVDKIIDPGFKIHKTCTEVTIHALMQMSESALLPFNVRLVPKAMQDTLKAFNQANVTQVLERNGASLKYVQEAVQEFQQVADNYMEKIEMDETLKTNPLKQRMINDQLMFLERTLLLQTDIPLQPGVRHASFAPGRYNRYGGGGFPAIPDLLFNIDYLSPEESTERWKLIRRYVSDLMISIQNAANFLKPLEQI